VCLPSIICQAVGCDDQSLRVHSLILRCADGACDFIAAGVIGSAGEGMETGGGISSSDSIHEVTDIVIVIKRGEGWCEDCGCGFDWDQVVFAVASRCVASRPGVYMTTGQCEGKNHEACDVCDEESHFEAKAGCKVTSES
jgi:hypothetical protein